ncbi:MAG: DUF1559 domain-containing protein [Planctomycetaceae bacterium]|jgi:prepilin-type processing-associated H-X9-DG protein|nr:DUF1559 domain-containing protein [Planctomycetaceae bacterium]
MKHLVLSALCAVVFMTVQASPVDVSAQETFAPLITDSTVAFVHLDFHNVRLDAVEEHIIKSSQEYLRELSFDKKSEEATIADLQDLLKQFDAFARPVWETMTQTLGIQEIAVVVDLKLAELSGSPGVIAMPWKNKTAADLRKFNALFPEDLDFVAVPAGGFLFVPVKDFPDPESEGEIIRGWFNGLEPVKDGKIYQALKAVEKAELKFAAAIPPELLEQISAEEWNDVPKEVAGLLTFAKRKVEWFAAGVPLDIFLTNKTDNQITAVIKTPKRSDAVQLRALLEQTVEFGTNAMRYGIEQEKDKDFQFPPVFFTFMKGYLRTWLPTVEDDKLVWKINQDGWTKAYTNQHGLIAAAGVSAALLLPAVQAAREAARRMQCTNVEKQIGLAIHNYHDTLGGLPPLYTVDKDGKPLHSWRVLILPFMEEEQLYEKIRLNEPWDSAYNKQFHNLVIDCYQCPSCQKKPGGCTYSAIVGGGLIPAKKAGDRTGGNLGRITDGTSNTLAIVEVKEPFCWMDPTADITIDEFVKGIRKSGINKKEEKGNPQKTGSFHPGGVNVLFFDGSVRFISDTINEELLKALATPDGGESLP